MDEHEMTETGKASWAAVSDTPEVAFCRDRCGTLTDAQKVMLAHSIKSGTFVGVGRAIGSPHYWPLCEAGKGLHVIDTAGYYAKAAMVEREAYLEA